MVRARARHRGPGDHRRRQLPHQRHSPTGIVEDGEGIVAIDRRCETVPLDKPWTAANALEWDSMTVRSWMDHGDTFAGWPFAGVHTADGRQLLELVVQAVWSCEPRDLSLLHLLFYVHAAGPLGSLLNTDLGAQDVPASWRVAARRGGHPTDPGGTHRVLTRDARSPRPAHPADTDRHGHQGPVRLPRALLARGRPGAVRSGQRVAAEVSPHLRPITNRGQLGRPRRGL